MNVENIAKLFVALRDKIVGPLSNVPMDKEIADEIRKVKGQIDRGIEELAAGVPLVNDLLALGLTRRQASILGVAFNYRAAPTATSLRRYVGLELRKDRTKSTEHKLLRAICLEASEHLVKNNKWYKAVYDKAVAHYSNRGWEPEYIHRAAIHKVAKYFLIHMWIRGRQRAGLEAKPLVDTDKTTVPEDFGWPHL